MAQIVLVLLVAGSVASLLCALHMFAASLFWPRTLCGLNAPTRQLETRRSRVARGCYLVAALIGMGALFYGGIVHLLWWMPENWGFVDDDGVYTSAASYIAGMVATVAALGVPFLLFRLAEAQVAMEANSRR